MNNKLRKLQFLEIELLDEFVRICDKYNLTYYLYYGTLLGAVRHKGFIPWDDDTDVVMPRRDFECFRKVAPKELSSDFFFHDNNVDPNNPSGLIRIRKNNTVYADEMSLRLNLMHYGIWIDIYPLDNVKSPKSPLFKFQIFLRTFLKPIVFHRSLKNLRGLPLIRKIIHYLSCIFPTKIWSQIRDALYKLNSDDTSDYCINFYSTYKIKNDLMPKEVFYPSIKVEFEGRKFNVPCHWNYVLKQIYGDYMTLPPEEKRTIYHNPSVWKM